jgi:hypothetical protein
VILMGETNTKEVSEIEVILDTVAQKGFIKFGAPKDKTVDDIVGMGAEQATRHRVKGGAAFKRMVSEGYQVKNAATGGIVKPETGIAKHAKDGKVHYLINAAGENGFYNNTSAIEETYNF